MSKIIRFLLIIIIFGFSHTLLSQNSDDTIKTYSYKEFIDMIHAEKDSVFELKNAIIEFNWETDEEFINYKRIGLDSFYDYTYLKKDSTKREYFKLNKVINREIALTNVQFKDVYEFIGDSLSQFSSLNGFKFKRKVRLNEVREIEIFSCEFESYFGIRNTYVDEYLKNFSLEDNYGSVSFDNNVFHEEVRMQFFNNDEAIFNQQVYIENNTFLSKPSESILHYYNLIFPVKINVFQFNGNTIYEGKQFRLNIDGIENIVEIEENSVNNSGFSLDLRGLDKTIDVNFLNNEFNKSVILYLDILRSSFEIDWWQFKNGFVSQTGIIKAFNNDAFKSDYGKQDSLILLEYDSKLKFENRDYYLSEVKLLSDFYKYYKGNFDSESSNAVYINIKELETRRMGYLNKENTSFKTFFRWQINRFLRVFSNYGTEPERAIIFSFYVILIFAGIYLFFPNTWDEHGRKRIMDRYAFFIKYMKRDAGIHQVYLEEKQKDLLEYEEFKTMIDESGKFIPKFFLATGYPLYKWAVLGTKTSARWLKRFDIVSGKWTDLPEKQRPWKSVLLIGAFIVALVYDLLIKVLNALMLSINTFTTLGFGEIPIKGLPRYLAIIQGFIGWFMLTIFSVSLISQLLLN